MLMRDGISVVISRQGKRFICSPKRPDRRRGRHCRLFSGNLSYLPGINRQWHEIKLRPPSNAEVKNEWSYTSTPPICLRDLEPGILYLFTFKAVDVWVFVWTEWRRYKALQSKCFYTFIHSVFCMTTVPKPPLKRFLHTVRSRASSFK